MLQLLRISVMPSHIFSWGENEHDESIALPSGTSIVSFDSILPDTKASSSATMTESPNTTESQAKAAINFIEVEMAKSRTPSSAYQGADQSFPRHEKYFFKDGNITFLVRGLLSPSLCAYQIYMLGCRSTARFIAFTDTFFLVTRSTFLPDCHSSTFRTMKRFLL